MKSYMRLCVVRLLWGITSFLCVSAQSGPVFNENIRLLKFEPLAYPLVAKVKRIEGTVVVRVELNKSGDVSAAKAISGPRDLLAEVVSNAKKWRFQPNVDMTAVIVYRFKRLEGLCELPCPSQFLVEPPNVATITVGEPTVTHGAH